MAFVPLLVWVAVFGASLSLQTTAWGLSGHPSRALVLSIVVLLLAPVPGLAGFTLAMTQKTTPRLKAVAMTANAALIAVGATVLAWMVFGH